MTFDGHFWHEGDAGRGPLHADSLFSRPRNGSLLPRDLAGEFAAPLRSAAIVLSRAAQPDTLLLIILVRTSSHGESRRQAQQRQPATSRPRLGPCRRERDARRAGPRVGGGAAAAARHGPEDAWSARRGLQTEGGRPSKLGSDKVQQPRGIEGLAGFLRRSGVRG